MPRLSFLAIAPLLFSVATVGLTPAQCDPAFLPGDASAGVVGDVYAMTRWDPDGPGPQNELIVVGGRLRLADSLPVNGIAAYDPVAGTWQALGSGVDGWVQTLLVLPNGNLLVGGYFPSAGGVPVGSLAEWNGSTWSAFGNGGVNSLVRALTLAANGDVIGAGDFWLAGGVPVLRLARWNGATWSALGAGLSHFVFAVAGLPNGDVIAGGSFVNSTQNGVLQGIARWDGTTWWPVPGLVNAQVRALRTQANGSLLVGGELVPTMAGPPHGLMNWNGTTWTPIGVCPRTIHAFDPLPNGDIVVGGQFSYLNNAFTPHVARWNGTAWATMAGGADGIVHAVVALPTGEVFVGGEFGAVGGVVAGGVARWSGGQWSALATGRFGHTAIAVVHLPTGELVLAGRGLWPGSTPSSADVVQWDGQSWTLLGHAPLGGVNDMAVAQNGDIVVVGDLSTIQGVPVSDVARWDGSAWTALPSGGPTTSSLRKIVALPNGDIACGQSNQVWQTDGSTWSQLGSLPSNVEDLYVTQNGDLLATGIAFTVRWNGTAWSPIGTGVGHHHLVELQNGDIVVAGSGGMRRFDGTAWQLVAGSPSPIHAMHVLPNGDVLVGGNFPSAGAVPAQNLARWNGTVWSEVAGGVDGPVHGFSASPTGEVIAFGDFGTVGIGGTGGPQVSAFLARLTSPCPATASHLAAGCPSSGGTNTVTATLPWLGSTWAAAATGLPANGFALACTSFATTTLPLQLLSPFGQPGCIVHVAPQFVVVLVPQQGRTTLQFGIPSDPALVGAVFHHQLVPVETNASGSIVALTATNALTLQIGSF